MTRVSHEDVLFRVVIKYGDYKSYSITINNYIAISRNNIKHFNERKVNKHQMENKRLLRKTKISSIRHTKYLYYIES